MSDQGIATVDGNSGEVMEFEVIGPDDKRYMVKERSVDRIPSVRGRKWKWLYDRLEELQVGDKKEYVFLTEGEAGNARAQVRKEYENDCVDLVHIENFLYVQINKKLRPKEKRVKK